MLTCIAMGRSREIDCISDAFGAFDCTFGAIDAINTLTITHSYILTLIFNIFPTTFRMTQHTITLYPISYIFHHIHRFIPHINLTFIITSYHTPHLYYFITFLQHSSYKSTSNLTRHLYLLPFKIHPNNKTKTHSRLRRFHNKIKQHPRKDNNKTKFASSLTNFNKNRSLGQVRTCPLLGLDIGCV
jgi:hypothetical protein